MIDWREHNGGPQPVADDVWVEVTTGERAALPFHTPARLVPYWEIIRRYRILNQHLIDAARKDGFEAGLEKSAEIANLEERQNIPRDDQHLIDAARLEGIRLGLEAAKRHAEAVTALQSGRLVAIPSLDPETIAKEAQHD